MTVQVIKPPRASTVPFRQRSAQQAAFGRPVSRRAPRRCIARACARRFGFQRRARETGPMTSIRFPGEAPAVARAAPHRPRRPSGRARRTLPRRDPLRAWAAPCRRLRSARRLRSSGRSAASRVGRSSPSNAGVVDVLIACLLIVRFAPAGPHRLGHRERTPVGGEPCARALDAWRQSTRGRRRPRTAQRSTLAAVKPTGTRERRGTPR